MNYTSEMVGLVALFRSSAHWDPGIRTIPEYSYLGRRIWHRPGGRGSIRFSSYEIPALLQQVSTRFNPIAWVSDCSPRGSGAESLAARRKLLDGLLITTSMLEHRWHWIAAHPGRRRTSEEGLQTQPDHQRRVMEEGILVFGVPGSDYQRDDGEVPRA